MTGNKRFTVDSDGKYFDRLNNRYLTIDNLLNELNSFVEENEQLNKEIKTLMKSKEMLNDVLDCYQKRTYKLDTENDRLRHENKELKSDRGYWKTLAQSLAKKNGKGVV